MSDLVFDPKSEPLRPKKAKEAPLAKRRLIIGNRATVARTVRRVPEVVIKITSNAKDRHAVNNLVDYIARLTAESKRKGIAPVVVEDEQGNTFVGEHARNDALAGWTRLPATGGKRREAFHIVFSMPASTDRESVTEAVRRFAGEVFRNHQYVFATHDEEDRPHVHVVVNATPYRGRKRLNPRKGDLQQWREIYAENLRDLGVEANATPRIARGLVERYDTKAVREMRARGANQTKAAFVQGHREPSGVIVDVEAGSSRGKVQAFADRLAGQGWAVDRHGRQVDPEKRIAALWPEEGRQRALHVEFGVVEGADLSKQQSAVMALAAERFTNHRYLVGVDSESSRVGVLINATPTSGADIPLKPKSPDVQRWREAYSEKLKDQGIEADAIANPSKSTLAKLDKVRAQVLSEYGAMAKELLAGNAEDKALAKEVTQYVQDMGMPEQVHSKEVGKDIAKADGLSRER